MHRIMARFVGMAGMHQEDTAIRSSRLYRIVVGIRQKKIIVYGGESSNRSYA
jgi:hypothetical protein